MKSSHYLSHNQASEGRVSIPDVTSQTDNFHITVSLCKRAFKSICDGDVTSIQEYTRAPH